MKTQFPPATQAKFDAVLAKLLECLKGAPKHTSARSEFMNYDGSTGGQVLESEPEIEHSYNDISKLYLAMFAQAKEEGLDLREVQVEFERKKAGGPWSNKTRFITAGEFKAFQAAVAPIAEEIRVALRKIAVATAADWRSVSFDWNSGGKTRVLVLHGAKVRAESKPTPQLAELATRVEKAAQAEGLVFTGGSWSVEAEMEDAEGEVDPALGVIRAWPEAT